MNSSASLLERVSTDSTVVGWTTLRRTLSAGLKQHIPNLRQNKQITGNIHKIIKIAKDPIEKLIASVDDNCFSLFKITWCHLVVCRGVNWSKRLLSKFEILFISKLKFVLDSIFRLSNSERSNKPFFVKSLVFLSIDCQWIFWCILITNSGGNQGPTTTYHSRGSLP